MLMKLDLCIKLFIKAYDKANPIVYKYLTFYRSHSHMFQTLKYTGTSDVGFHKIDLQIFLNHSDSIKLYDSLALRLVCNLTMPDSRLEIVHALGSWQRLDQRTKSLTDGVLPDCIL